MSSSTTTRSTGRRGRAARTRLLGLVVVVAFAAIGIGRLGTVSSAMPPVLPDRPRAGHSMPRSAARDIPRRRVAEPGPATGGTPKAPSAPLGEADGAIPDDTTVFDASVPGVVELDPGLLRALRGAGREAARVGLTLEVHSGWRSAAYQQHLLDEAVARYGSRREAVKWVAPPDASAHVSGDAVDLGPPAAASWLSRHGAAYGLCRVYGNEPWHYELRPAARSGGCPALYADASQDPRLQPR